MMLTLAFRPCLPELPQTPWLIEFASEREVGVAPGKPAFQLLERAIIEGNRDQRLAAIYYLGLSGNPAAAPRSHRHMQPVKKKFKMRSIPDYGTLRLAGFRFFLNPLTPAKAAADKSASPEPEAG